MILKIVGLFFVGLAIVGAVLPVLPTTPFLLVAATCFAKSSPTLYKKLSANKVFGPLIKNWQEHRAISLKSKRVALLSMVLAASWSCYVLEAWWLKLLVLILITGPFIFLWRLPLIEK